MNEYVGRGSTVLGLFAVFFATSALISADPAASFAAPWGILVAGTLMVGARVAAYQRWLPPAPARAIPSSRRPAGPHGLD
jgi:hypothetical protein